MWLFWFALGLLIVLVGAGLVLIAGWKFKL